MLEKFTDEVQMLLALMCLGAIIGLGKLLASDEVLTVRLVAGRMILGSATSTVAGVVLMQIPNIQLIPLIAIASAMGIGGYHVIEAYVKDKSKT